MGCANCGSTLLTTLLGRHSEITTVGELKVTAIRDIDTYLCGCGEPILECSFWKSVRTLCRASGVELDLARFDTHFQGSGGLDDKLIRTAIRNPFMEWLRRTGLACYRPAKRELARLLNRNQHLMDAICTTEGKAVFLDGSKDPARLLHFWRSGLFDVRPIYLVRDGRAIVASYKKRDQNMARNIALWKMKALECERVRKMLPGGSLLTLRYEDLCADAPRALSAIFKFAGLPDESRTCMEPTQCASQHIIGHNSRLSGTKEVKLREEWSSLLSDRDLQIFGTQAGRLNAAHGYTA
jgi:hypothetical protein